MELWIWFGIGCVSGIILGYVIFSIFRIRNDARRHAGVLRMDRSDPNEAPYLFLELEPNGMDIIHKNNTVILNVNLESYLSRK